MAWYADMTIVELDSLFDDELAVDDFSFSALLHEMDAFSARLGSLAERETKLRKNEVGPHPSALEFGAPNVLGEPH